MFTISDTTKKNLERTFGMSLVAFSSMTADEERQWMNDKIGKKITFRKSRHHQIIGRSHPLLARRKIRTMEELSQKSRDLFSI